MDLANDLFSQYQHTCLELFADSIRLCDHYGSHKWGVAIASSDQIRLLMGSLIVATIEQSCFWLEIDPPEESERKVLDKFINLQLTSKDCYKRPVGQSAYYWPMKNHTAIWPTIKRLQVKYLAIVADKYDHLRVDSQPHHSDELLISIEEYLGIQLPRPDYRIPKIN